MMVIQPEPEPSLLAPGMEHSQSLDTVWLWLRLDGTSGDGDVRDKAACRRDELSYFFFGGGWGNQKLSLVSGMSNLRKGTQGR